jgi:RNA polymerase sigma factor (sigma-70 family)
MNNFSIRRQHKEFEKLIRPQLDYMYRLAYRFCLNQHDAEDLVQDVIIKLYAKDMVFDEIDNLKPWLGKVIYRQFIDNIRRNSRSPIDGFNDNSMETEFMADVRNQPDHLLDREYTLNEIAAAFTQLNEEQRVVVTLHDIEGYSLKDMELMTETPIGTLKSRLHRARAKIKSEIAGDE